MKSPEDKKIEFLQLSKNTGCVVGIKLRQKRKPIITAVQNLSEQEVILKPASLYGHEIPKTTILISEIEQVTRFNTKYEDPFFVRLRGIKRSIKSIRATIGR